MDNLTHSLVGLAAAKAGLERVSPGATVMCIIAANAPDADIVTTLSGRWAYLHHHRGITHSIIGTLVLAVLIPFLFWLGDHVVARISGREPRVNLRGLLIASLIVSATHPLLDWTNNYGIRPLLPWNSRWYYGDLVFIIDPWIWLSLGGACFLLTAKSKWHVAAWSLLAAVITYAIVFIPSFRPGATIPLAARVCWLVAIAALFMGHRAKLAHRWGRAIPIAAFALLVTYWGGLAVLHRRALAQSNRAAVSVASSRGETVNRLAAMPVLANPLMWQCVFETDRATYRFELFLDQPIVSDQTIRYEKPVGKAAEFYSMAADDERAKVFLGFARFPVIRVSGDCISETLVEFADLRYTEPGRGRRGTFSLDVQLECPRPIGALETK